MKNARSPVVAKFSSAAKEEEGEGMIRNAA